MASLQERQEGLAVEAHELQLEFQIPAREALVASYSFNTAKRSFAVRHMKEVKRRGLSVASGSFPVGSNVRIRNKRKG